MRRILSACEETPRKQGKSLVTSVSSRNPELVLECAFIVLSGMADRSEFTSLQLAMVAYTPLWEDMFWQHAACQSFEACPCDCTLYSCDSS